VRGISLVLAVASAAGLAGLSAPAPAQAAGGDSAVTVAWAGGNADALQQYQPERDTASVHYGDFKDVTVTVPRTTDLVDEALTVTVSGMPGATQALHDGGVLRTFGASFVQAMQCWGDPADPLFYENCQWGAFGPPGAGNAAPDVPTYGALRGGENGKSLPFRAVTGKEYSSLLVGDTGEATEMLQAFRAQTTNERTATVDSTGTARFSFEVQSAASQPYLGCGDEKSATGTRCWLVIVPRGLHNSTPVAATPASPSTPEVPGCTTLPAAPDAATGGVRQDNSPINPRCEFWANRILVPLDFRPTGSVCAAGATERRVVGTEGMSGAFASWQSALCGATGTAYSFTTSADAVARQQLLTGQAQMAITSEPLTADSLPPGADPVQLAETDVVYAPVAVSGVTISFLAVQRGQVQSTMRLSPRLIAKLLTQSYPTESGLYTYSVDPVTGPWSSGRGTPLRLNNDPEFQALNEGSTFRNGGSIVLTGPNESDAIALLWAYVQADAAARAFLAGEPDNVLPGDEGNSGMTINPYYLPQGDADARVPEFVEGTYRTGTGVDVPALLPAKDAAGAVLWRGVGLTGDDGSPLCLCDGDVASFPKADETLMPQLLQGINQTERYDSLQMRPYATTAEGSARLLFRADTGAKTQWDPSKSNGPGLPTGGYVGGGQMVATNMFLTAYTDTPSAARYLLPTAELQVPDQRGVFVAADEAGMTAAVGAQSATAVAGVMTTDPATLPTQAYPLTSVLYAAVNLGAADEAAREQYADLIEYAVTDGQTPGHSIGQLPEGYLPLSDAQREQALAAVAAIRAYVPAGADGGDAPTAEQPAGADVAAQTGYAQDTAATPTATQQSIPGTSAVLGGTLLAGLAGAVAGPFLLRRRELTT
jgi:hypothetical protein